MSNELESMIEENDPEEFLEYLEQFPDQLQTAHEIGQRCSDPGTGYQQVLVCGMGGSGITGDLLSTVGFRDADVPIITNKHYNVPGWVDEETLVILISYSGTTEETISCYHETRKRNAQPVALTSNGDLEVHARKHDYPVITIPPDHPPRASAGYLLVPALHALDRAGLMSAPSGETIRETAETLLDLVEDYAPAADSNRAHELARDLAGDLIVLVGSDPHTSALAERFRNQIHENAKAMAVAEPLPEINHNQIMGWDHLSDFQDPSASVVFLRDREEHPRVRERFDLTREMFQKREIPVYEIQGRGDHLFTRSFALMLYTDYISYYLAMERSKDPHDITTIEELKDRLAGDD